MFVMAACTAFAHASAAHRNGPRVVGHSAHRGGVGPRALAFRSRVGHGAVGSSHRAVVQRSVRDAEDLDRLNLASALSLSEREAQRSYAAREADDLADTDMALARAISMSANEAQPRWEAGASAASAAAPADGGEGADAKGDANELEEADLALALALNDSEREGDNAQATAQPVSETRRAIPAATSSDKRPGQARVRSAAPPMESALRVATRPTASGTKGRPTAGMQKSSPTTTAESPVLQRNRPCNAREDASLALAVENSMWEQRGGGDNSEIAAQAARESAERAVVCASVASRIATLAHGNELPLPSSLRGLQNVRVHHIEVARQGVNECGPRAVINALAVQSIVQAGGRPVTSSNVKAVANTWKTQMNTEGYDRVGDTLMILAQKFGLSNAHIIMRSQVSIDGQGRIIRNNPEREVSTAHAVVTRNAGSKEKGSASSAKPPLVRRMTVLKKVASTPDRADNEGSIDDVYASLILKTDPITTFIANVGGHWVSFVVVRLPGDKSTDIYYTDSTNFRLSDASCATWMILEIYTKALSRVAE